MVLDTTFEDEGSWDLGEALTEDMEGVMVVVVVAAEAIVVVVVDMRVVVAEGQPFWWGVGAPDGRCRWGLTSLESGEALEEAIRVVYTESPPGVVDILA